MLAIAPLMKRIIFLNRYFYPDHSATSQLLSDLAFHLAATGRQVHVITSTQAYDNANSRLPKNQIVNGVHIHRIATTRFGRSRLVGRGIDYASFYAGARRLLRQLVQRDDILIALTDPPLLSIIAARAARRRGAQLINWLQDIYPEVAAALDIPLLGGRIGSLICRFRNASLRQGAANAVLGQRMREQLSFRGIDSEKIEIIHNWSDDVGITPHPLADNPLRRAWGLDGKYVVAYSGNLGRAHEFDALLDASARLRLNAAIVFACFGSGHRMNELAAQVKARGLDASFRFFPYQDRAQLKYSLGAADVHWISLRPALEGLIVPSKFYGVAAAGRPIIVITARDGELARLIREFSCGLVIEPGHADTLAQELTRLSHDPQAAAEMGGRARAMLDGHFTREQALARWSDLVGRLDKS